MEYTISAMVGKGSVTHNSRAFTAKNVDAARSENNIEYCNENLKDVYHELFDEAVERYNSKQTRKDRTILDYYEKIRTGKQEKLFHEVIFQIGNMEDCNAETAEGQLSKKILDRFMKGFQKRNPQLRVFSAHLHMDEQTPHLHIDFVPFTTGSKRGLDTRVSLKKALEQQGFKGSSRNETEWKLWIESEKHQLAQIMAEYGIEWKQLGTHEKHLSVFDYQKKMRTAEVAELENTAQKEKQHVEQLYALVEQKSSEVDNLSSELTALTAKKVQLTNETKKKQTELKTAEKKLKEIQNIVIPVETNVRVYDEEPQWRLPDSSIAETGNHYRTKKALPLVQKLIKVIKSITFQYIQLKSKFNDLVRRFEHKAEALENLTKRFREQSQENEDLREAAYDLQYVKNFYGEGHINNIIQTEKQREYLERHSHRKSRNDLSL